MLPRRARAGKNLGSAATPFLSEAARARNMASIRIDGWRSSIRFDAAHMIPGHPKCGRLHGHTYAIHAEVHGAQGASGFIMDFGEVKAALKRIADRLDHHVLLPGKSPGARLTVGAGMVSFDADGKRYEFPQEDAEVLPIEHTSAESLAEHVADLLVSEVRFPSTVSRIEIGVDESYGKGAWTARSF